jgi:hypothetical protein
MAIFEFHDAPANIKIEFKLNINGFRYNEPVKLHSKMPSG